MKKNQNKQEIKDGAVIDDQSILVRCKCGYTMRRRPEQPRHGETWLCFTWHHRTAPERVFYCPICGEASSCLSTQPIMQPVEIP